MIKRYLAILLILLSGCTDGIRHAANAPAATCLPLPAIADTNAIKAAAPEIIYIADRPAAVKYYEPAATAGTDHTPTKTADPYIPMRHFSTAQGLGLAFVTCQYTDHAGNVWLGTQGGGVSKYDGISFTTYTLEHGLGSNIVYCMTEDKYGNMWFGAWGHGITRFNGNTFTSFDTSCGLTSNFIEAMTLDHRGNLWLGADGKGLSCYALPTDTARHIPILLNLTTKEGLLGNVVNAVMEDRNGAIWCAIWETGVNRLEFPKEDKWTNIRISSLAQRDGMCSNTITGMAQDTSGGIWLSSWGGGISHYAATGKGTFTNYNRKNGLVDDMVKCVFIDASGTVWLGTNKGVSRFANGTFHNLTVAEGLSHNDIRCIGEDSRHRIWIGTSAGGATCYASDAVSVYGTRQGLPNSAVWAMAPAGANGLWLGTFDSGLVCRENGLARRYTAGGMLIADPIFCLYTDSKERLWVGTDHGGVFCFDGHSFTNYTTRQGLAGNRVFEVAEDRSGRIWMATKGGVSCFNGTSFTNYTTTQGLASNRINGLAIDSGQRIWLACVGGISAIYPARAGAHDSIVNYNHRLASNQALHICTDKNNFVWICTDGGGIVRYDGHSFLTFNTTQGLANNVVIVATCDARNTLWTGSNEGLSALKGFRLRNNSPGTHDGLVIPAINTLNNEELATGYVPIFENYNEKTGYDIRDFNPQALYAASDGSIWAGTGELLTRFDYYSLPAAHAGPAIKLRNIRINNEPISWYGLQQLRNNTGTSGNLTEEVLNYGTRLKTAERDSILRRFSNIRFDSVDRYNPVPVHLSLPYSCNDISFSFSPGPVLEPALIQYECTLIGYDRQPLIQTGQTSVSYGNIREGTYTLSIRARERNGNWGLPLVYQFTVQPPAYRSWWAYVLYIIASCCAVYLIIAARLRRLSTENTRLEKIVVERTSELTRKNMQLAISNNEKDRILGVVAHDLRSPLGAVLYYTDIMLMEDGTALDMHQSLSLIRGSISDSLQLVNELLELSVEEQKNMILQPMSIYKLLQGCMAVLSGKAIAKGIKLQLAVTDNDVMALVDAGKMRRAIGNILDNSIKFSPADTEVQTSIQVTDEWVTILIKDNGIGIPSDKVEGLFEIFTTTKRQGTGGEKSFGLGLSISRQIVEAHGGSIWLESQENEGTTFFIKLPLSTDASQ